MIRFSTIKTRAKWWGLTPIAVFLLSYLGGSIILQDFYKVPLAIAFTLASAYAVLITRGIPFEERIAHFSRGASDGNIMLMLWIFILSGAFSASAKAMGAIDATVQTFLYLLPASLILPGLFLTACFVSLSIGTSVGTIVALAPMALALGERLGVEPAFMAGLIAGGAFFGDNLSFISDTTIAATRLMGCRMSDKFRANVRMALPAALLSLGLYAFAGKDLIADGSTELSSSPLLVVPYLIVLGASISGMNVILVLILGILSSGIVGLWAGSIEFWDWIASLGRGMNDMGELIIVTLLAGGLLELIRYNGGFDYMIAGIRKSIKSERMAELAIGLLVSFAGVCTANNTIAILSVGAMARDIADTYRIDPRRAASVLDIFSCITQSFVPYGAQLLIIASLSGLSPLEIVPSNYYAMILLIITLIIMFFFPRKRFS